MGGVNVSVVEVLTSKFNSEICRFDFHWYVFTLRQEGHPAEIVPVFSLFIYSSLDQMQKATRHHQHWLCITNDEDEMSWLPIAYTYIGESA